MTWKLCIISLQQPTSSLEKKTQKQHTLCTSPTHQEQSTLSSINFLVTKTWCQSRFPKSHVGSFQNFSPSHLHVLSTLSPCNMFCATGGRCPTKGKWKKRPLVVFAHRDEMDVSEFGDGFHHFSLNTFAQSWGIFLNPSMIEILIHYEGSGLVLKARRSSEKTAQPNWSPPGVEHGCGSQVPCKQKGGVFTGEDGYFSNLALL